MAEEVTATEDELADQILEGQGDAGNQEPEGLTQAQKDYLDSKFQEFSNTQTGRFTNWTAQRTKEADEAIRREMDEIRAERQRERDYILSQMDEDQREEFLRTEREKKIDALLENQGRPQEPQQPAQQQEGLTPEQQQLGVSVQSYAQAKNLTLSEADSSWLWAGATAGMSMSEYDALAKKNIDARTAQAPAGTPPPSATPPPANPPPPAGAPPSTSSAPKGQSVNIESMTVSELADAYLNGDITDLEYRQALRM